MSLDLSGSQNAWFYGYYGQLGSRGFFGDYDVDASSTGGLFASLNGWMGNPQLQAPNPAAPVGTPAATTADIANALVSGTSGATSQFVLNVDPKYGNDWVTLRARYTIGAYSNSASQGSVAVISPGQLTLWDVRVRTPIADITAGKVVFHKGCSLEFSRNRSTEYLMLEREFCVPDILGCLVASGVLPKGVMSWFNPRFWPRYKTPEDKTKETMADNPEYRFFGGDSNSNKSIFKLREERQEKDPDFSGVHATLEEQERDKNWPTDDDAYAWGHTGPGYLRIGYGFFLWETPTAFPSPLTPLLNPSTVTNTVLWNINDLGANAVDNLIGTVTYCSTDLEFGVGCLRSVYHQGPELQPLQLPPLPVVALRNQSPTFERYVTEGWAYLKYNNGQFFLNSELDWFNRVYRFQRSLNGTFFGQPDNIDGSGSQFASKYWESWRYVVEGGAMFGPLATRLFYCFLPGPDRRHGVYIDRQPFIQELPQQSFGLFDPYSVLLSYRFGGGVNAPGHISDASVFAVKMDYLVASNLLLQWSLLHAIRTSNGYALGYVRPDTTPATVAVNFGHVAYGEPPGSTPTNPAPSVPDRDLGWEATGGIVWELLDGWAVAARIAYWRPGRWFNYACIDKGVPNWDHPSAANNWGVRPDRVIDPIIAFELTLGATY